MFITQSYWSDVCFFSTVEEAEKHISNSISPSEKIVIAEVVKAFKSEPIPYVSVILDELNTKTMIESKV